MPGLFSRRKAKAPSRISSDKPYLGAVSSTDVDRLGLGSPTPSSADASVLPPVPTKDDLPRPPPKDPSSRLSSLPPNVMPADMQEFGQISSSDHTRAHTIATFTQTNDKNYLRPGSAYTLNSARRPNAALHTVTSRSTLGQSKSSASSAYDASSLNGSAVPKASYIYGYTTEGWHIQLEPTRVLALLEACGEQIRTRGLDNPLIFSSMALDLSPANVASLIKSFSATTAGQRALPQPFLEEILYANPHDLAAVIKWAFARLGRVLAVPVPVSGSKKGDVREEMVYVQQRGFLDLESYNAWREQERRQHYPATAFNDFIAQLSPPNAKLLSTLFSLLSSTASYSLKNGMMPAKLSKLFGVLLFGLPEDETFARTYDAYVRASNATEHLLYAYIRFQATTSTLPPKLAQHINGYPSILPSEITVPSASSKLVPITQIERTVRLYSADLVQTACEMDLTESCPEWEDCKDSNEALGKDPQLSDKFRKLVNLRGGATQGRKLGAGRSRTTSADSDDTVAVHSSLVSKRWDDFLSGGFSAPDSSKLAFDLNESAKRNPGPRRETVQWNTFHEEGFQSSDSRALAEILSFDDMLKHDVQNWPAEREQIHAKLKSTQDKLPPFNYDTTPRLLTSPTLAGVPEGKHDLHPISRMDETFAEVWADYLLGSGWSNRDELTHRNANFVIVQYKSRPNASTVGSQSAGSSLSAPTRFQVSARKDESVPKDERVDAAWFVIQEVVPAQYRVDLEAAGRGTSKGRAMIRKLTMFRLRREKEKSNGGSTHEKVATDSSDDVFKPGPGGQTKRILLSDQLRRNGSSKNASRSSLRSNRASTERDRSPRMDGSDGGQSQEGQGHAQSRSEGGGSKLISVLRAKSVRMVKSARRGASSPGLHSHADEFGNTAISAEAASQGSRWKEQQQGDMLVDRSFTSADYETHSVAEEDNASITSSSSGFAKRKPTQFKPKDGAKRQQGGNDEAWIDIMVRANGTRMSGQDAAQARKPTNPPRKGSFGLPKSQVEGTSHLGLSAADIQPRTTSRGSPLPLAPSESEETVRNDGPPRSSTPTALDAHSRTAADDVGLTRIESRPSVDESELLPDSTNQSSVGMRSATASGIPKPAAALDPVAAARAALKTRREQPPRATGEIDTKKLVESLRAGLSPIEAVRASKADKSLPASPIARTALPTANGKGYRDPFAKDPVVGRVADVASRFGGKAGAGGTGKEREREKPLPLPVSVPVSSSGYVLEPASASAGVGSAMMRASMDSEEIYPEDAASNFDPKDRYQSPEWKGNHLQLPGEDEEGDMEHLNATGEYAMRWRGLRPSVDEGEGKGKGEGEGEEAPSRFAQPYQPGMPLDNVLEESESVLSGSTNY